MAEGGYDFGFKDSDLDALLDEQDDSDDEKEVNRTRPFQPDEPGAASTPYNRGETIEMQTMHHERSGLPDTSYQETTTEELERRLAVLRSNAITGLPDMTAIELQNITLSYEYKPEAIQKVRDFIKIRYPNAKFDSLIIRFSEKKLNQIVVVGPKGGETKILLDDGSGLLQSFLDKTFVKNALGKPADTVIKNTSADIRKRQKELESERNKKEQARKKLKRTDRKNNGLK